MCDLKKKKGSIYHRVHYVKYKKPNTKGKQLLENEGGLAADEEVLDIDDEIDELEYLLYFRTCLVDRDIEILKIKLTQSIQMREKLIKKKDTQFHKMFPFYFIQPTLVCLKKFYN